MNVLELQQKANEQLERNDIASANTTLTQIFQLVPDDLDVLRKLAWTHFSLGDSQGAIALYNKLFAKRPGLADENYYLAMAYGQLGQMKQSRQCLSRIIHQDPKHIIALLKLGYIDYMEGNIVSSMSFLMRVKAIDPDNVELNISLGRHYTAKNEFKKAEKHYAMALKVSPENTEAIAQFASLYAFSGEAEKSFKMLQPFLGKKPINLSIGLVFAEICRSIGRCDEAKLYLEEALKQNMGNIGKSSLLFALGKIYDRNKCFDLAFEAYKEANELNSFSYSAWEEHQIVQEVQKVLDVPFLQKSPKAKNLGKSLKPIFIIGMPRSGTSLVEQILSSHRLVHGAGERQEMSIIAKSLREDSKSTKGYPFCLPDATSQLLTTKAKQYLKALAEKAPNSARFITDKMPDNYNHVALIQQLFPKAKIIHCVRDPRDTCLSSYFTRLMGHAFSYNLKDLGAHYGIYHSLMNHWKKVIKLPIFDVSYEDMVADPEKTSREIVEFCGLEWDKNCLNFHENKRNVVTASTDQVRQPIYTKSISRWKNYESHLGELFESLKRTM